MLFPRVLVQFERPKPTPKFATDPNLMYSVSNRSSQAAQKQFPKENGLAERIVVTLDIRDDDNSTLSVQDVFAQVEDLFNLASDDTQSGVIWRLVSATTNSPFTIVAESASRISGVVVDDAARHQRERFVRNTQELQAGRIPRQWADGSAHSAVRRVLQRTVRGIAKMSISVAPASHVLPQVVFEVTPKLATPLIATIEALPRGYLPSKKEQVGSIVGKLIEVGHFYSKPAIHVEDRLTGELVWCVVTEEDRRRIADAVDFDDVWSGHRVAVSGRIHYDDQNKIQRITATNVRPLDMAEVSDDALKQRGFTDGLTSGEYLDKFREGNLGRH